MLLDGRSGTVGGGAVSPAGCGGDSERSRGMLVPERAGESVTSAAAPEVAGASSDAAVEGLNGTAKASRRNAAAAFAGGFGRSDGPADAVPNTEREPAVSAGGGACFCGVSAAGDSSTFLLDSATASAAAAAATPAARASAASSWRFVRRRCSSSSSVSSSNTAATAALADHGSVSSDGPQLNVDMSTPSNSDMAGGRCWWWCCCC